MSKIAKQYSQALFDAALDANALDAVFEDLKIVMSVGRESRELQHFLNLPQIAPDRKKAVVEQIFQERNTGLTVDQQAHMGVVQRFIDLLIDRGRQNALPEIMKRSRRLL